MKKERIKSPMRSGFPVLAAVFIITVMCGAFAAQFRGIKGLSFPYLPSDAEKPILQIVISSFAAIRPVIIAAVVSLLPFGRLLSCIVVFFYLFSFSYTLSLMTAMRLIFVTPQFYDALCSFLIALPAAIAVSSLLYARRITPSAVLLAVSFIACVTLKSLLYILTVL